MWSIATLYAETAGASNNPDGRTIVQARLHDLPEDEPAERLGVGGNGTGGDGCQPLDTGGVHAGNDVGRAVGVDGDRGLGEWHAEGGDDGIGPVDRRGDNGPIVDVAAGNLEAPVLDWEGVGAAGERDRVMVSGRRVTRCAVETTASSGGLDQARGVYAPP
jgi:hypothetical protein